MGNDALPRITTVTAAGRATFNDDQVDRLRRVATTRFCRSDGPVPLAVLAEMLDGATVAGLTPLTVPRLDEETIAALPGSLRGIAVFATGVDFIDLAALGARGISLRRLPGYSTTTVAEHTIGLLLTLSRRLHLSRDRVLGRVPETTSVRGWELCGKTIGIVGMGRIGRRVATLAGAFGMEVIGTDLRDGVCPDVELHDLDELLVRADVVSLHASTSWRRGPLLAEAELRRMRPHAYLVNASRASLVDERAVVTAVAAGRLSGYAVDDRLSDSVREEAAALLQTGRIVESGHTAWYSQEAIDRGTEAWVDLLVELTRDGARTPPDAEATSTAELQRT